jgi:hypothetical protein
MRTKIFNAVRISGLAIALSLGMSYVYAWTAPTVAPTGGNAAAPINVSSNAQSKAGPFAATALRAGVSMGTPDAIAGNSTGGYGVVGSGSSGGVYGSTFGSGTPGVTGTSNNGVGGQFTSTSNTGVTGTGVTGVNGSGFNGVVGASTSSGNGGQFTSATGVGVTASGASGIQGTGTSGSGVQGSSSTGYGVSGTGGGVGVYGNGGGGPAIGATNAGVAGTGLDGVYGAGTNNGVHGAGPTGVMGEGTSYGVVGWGGASGAGVYGINQNGGAGVIGNSSTSYDFLGSHGEKTVGGSWTNGSSRDLKENFAPVNNQSILAKIIALPMTQWNYKSDKNGLHIGPIAQDFYSVFGLGSDDISISTIDPAGVALVGVKALNEKIDSQQKQIDELRAEIQALKK